MRTMGVMGMVGTMETVVVADVAHRVGAELVEGRQRPPYLKEPGTMKNDLRRAGYGALLALLLTGVMATASAAVTLQLGSSSEIPAAEGKVKLKKNRNGNIEIKLEVKHLAPPGRIIPGASVFVVWARGLAPEAAAQNLGALKVDKNLKGKLTADTAMSSFDLFITCEQSQTVTAPAAPELLPVHYLSK